MLRITNPLSSKAATRYYNTSLAQADYYAEEPGFSSGKGAQRLGLVGQVTREQFGAIAENRDPRNHERLTVRTKDDRRAGYDFTFSVPKSVSLYVAMSGDRQVERMIMESFRETMTLIENAMQTRVRGKGRDGVERDCDRCTSNMMYAAFVHRETRPVEGISDPHFHIHAFVFNATWDQEETRWKAVQFGNTKPDAPFYEAGFHSLLASKLLEAGYAIRRTERDFELACVSRELIGKFSKRTALIEQIFREEYIVIEAEARALAKRTKIDFFDAVAEVKGALGSRTRERKSQRKLAGDELLNNWRSQMTPEELASLSPEAVRAALPENLLETDTAKGLAIQHLFERVSVVRELHATAMLLRRGIGGVSIDEALEFARRDLRFLRAGGGLVTTLEVLAEESAMLERIQAGRGRYEEIRRSGDWTFLSPLLGDEQKKAVLKVLHSRDMVISVRGPAGSGKTLMMQEAVKAVAALSGRDVLVVAPSTSAVKVLKEQGFSGADTFQRLMQSQLLQDVARGRILWIDEAGFLSTRQMRWAVDFAAKNDCRLILFGDTRQHHSVDRGDALRVLEDPGSIDQVALTKIFRQQVPALREAVEDLSRGETEAGFDKLEAAGLIHGVEDTDQRLEAIASQHLAAVGDGATSLIVALTHAECRAIAARVRELQKTACLVSPEEHQVVCLERLNLTESQRRDAINYRAGQVVEFHRRARGGFKSGEKWEVIASDEKGVTVSRAGKQTLLPLAQANGFELSERREIALAAGDSVRITKNFRCAADRFTNNELCRIAAIDQAGIHLDDGRLIKVAEAVHLDQGIAVTSHASQGKTVDQVIVSVPVSAFSQANQAQFYVSMSRARASMHLFTDSKAALKDAVMRPSERLSPYEFISKSGNGRDLVAFVTRSGREAVKQTEREMER
jgi:conjugative relaxase-like TrwC/TraI family protein